MRKRNVVAAVFAVTCITATGAIAAPPDSPGCFGRDRAAYATVNGSYGAPRATGLPTQRRSWHD